MCRLQNTVPDFCHKPPEMPWGQRSKSVTISIIMWLLPSNNENQVIIKSDVPLADRGPHRPNLPIPDLHHPYAGLKKHFIKMQNFSLQIFPKHRSAASRSHYPISISIRCADSPSALHNIQSLYSSKAAFQCTDLIKQDTQNEDSCGPKPRLRTWSNQATWAVTRSKTDTVERDKMKSKRRAGSIENVANLLWNQDRLVGTLATDPSSKKRNLQLPDAISNEDRLENLKQ